MALPSIWTPVAKSLHTLTVIQQVARLILEENTRVIEPMDAEDLLTVPQALDMAMEALGLAGRPDPYGLKARALALLLKEA